MEQFIALSELQEQIRVALMRQAGEAQWVVAEISEAKVNYAGHCYLELVERPERAKAPVAQARGVIWASTYKMISGYFRFQTGSDLEAGMKVLIKCNVSYHPVYGLSLNISDIDPAYTIGETERIRRQTIAQLQEEGVFDMNRDFELPAVVQRIAVISSARAAGYQDFVEQLESSGYRFDLKLFAAVMQGDSAEESIVKALDKIAAHDAEFEAVVLIRGGGSTSDLGAFDNYRICSYIAQFPLPVITGIGHDKDVSVADMVAHTALKTPTAVAAFLIDGAREVHGVLETLYEAVTGQAVQFLVQESARLENASLVLENRTGRLIHSEMNRIESLRHELRIRTSNRLVAETRGLGHIKEQVRAAAEGLLVRQRSKLDWLEVSVAAASPKRILERGYAIIRQEDGKVLLLAADAVPGESVGIEMRDGTVTAQVKTKTMNR